MNNQKIANYGIVVMITIWALVLLAIFVQGIEINPGNDINLTCNSTNQTFNITCIDNNCTNTTCPQVGMCEINTSIFPGESYNNTEGVCDINLFCMQQPRYVGEVYFPGVISIDKTGNSITVDIDIRNHEGGPYQRNTYPAYYEDIISIEFPFNFSCPAELVTDVNFATCQKYLGAMINTSNPVLGALAISTSDLSQELVKCYGDIIGHENRADNYEQLYHEENKRSQELTHELEDCQYNLNDPLNGTCAIEKNKLLNEMNRRVDPMYMVLTWILVLVLIAMLAMILFHGGK